MRYSRRLWHNGPMLTLEASRAHQTRTHCGGYGHRLAIVSRFGTSQGVYPILAIGEADSPDDALASVAQALHERQTVKGSDRFEIPEDFVEGEWADDHRTITETWDGNLILIDEHTDVAVVTL